MNYVNMLLFIKNFLSSITFRKIVIIFSVGLTTRIFINYCFDVNVFKEYTSFISLWYYLGMSSFTVFINSLPAINWNVFNVAIVTEAINTIIFGRSDHMMIQGYFSDNLSYEVTDAPKNLSNSKLQLAAKHGDAIRSSRQPKGQVGSKYLNNGTNKSHSYNATPGAGAALQGLYEKNTIKLTKNAIPDPSNKCYINVPGSGAALSSVYNTKPTISRNPYISYPYDPRGTLLSNSRLNPERYPGYLPSRVSTTSGDIPVYLSPSLDQLQTQGCINSDSRGTADSVQRVNTKGQELVLEATRYTSEEFARQQSNSTDSTNPSRTVKPSNHTKTEFVTKQRLSNIQEERYSELYQADYDFELMKRKEKVLQALQNKEVISDRKRISEQFSFSGLNGSVLKLTFDFDNKRNKIISIFLKYYEKGERQLYWSAWERKHGQFSCYSEFKSFWKDRGETVRSLHSKAGCNVKDVVSELVRIRNPFNK